MSRNGSGTYSLYPGVNPVVTGTTITSSWANNSLNDMATAMTASIANDGQTPILANLPMSTYRHTGVGNATARTHYAAAGQIQDNSLAWGGTAVGTADALTIALSPVITAYVTGQRFLFITGASPNATTTPTLAVNGLSALTFKRKDGTTIAAADLPATTLCEAVYNGTNVLLMDTGPALLTKLGTITVGTWNASVITPVYGGTGVANNAASTLTISGAFATTFTVTNTTAVTFPTTGTLAVTDVAQTFTKAQRGAYVALTDAGTVAVDASLANEFSLLLGGSRTLGVPTNMVAGQSGSIDIRQDATGSRTLAYSWPYVWVGGVAGVLSTPGCSLDQLIYEVSTYANSAVTITIATPGVVTWAAHGLTTGQRIQITTTGALPTGLTASTTYFWTTIDANSGKLSTTLVNCAAGTYIATTGSQSGVHTMTGATVKLALNKAWA